MSQLNQIIFSALFSLAHRAPWLDALIIFFARDLAWLWPAALVLLPLLYRRRPGAREGAAFAAGAALLAWVASEAIKLFYRSARPFATMGGITVPQPLIDLGFSPAFPSGHASFLFALAIALYFYNRTLGAVSLVIAVLVSLARVAAGLHWPGDIVGGFFLGLLIAVILRSLVIRLLGARPYSRSPYQ